ncbi:DUF6233 domain-containing protein [Streptomyces sp. NPDC001297]|uniref:DUF6233 domain-containing protein n=1 Tax=Streptomyces sp. NPDC001297 TaxID=3364559 RepID=UPI003682F058
MSELPSDAPRLRAILAHLDQQIADTDTIGTYLRLQRDAVQAALSRTGHTTTPRSALPTPQRRPRQLPQGQPQGGTASPPVGLVTEEQRKDGGPSGGMIHTAACMPHMQLRPITPETARQVLAKDSAFFTPCPLCRPDTDLGIDVA